MGGSDAPGDGPRADDEIADRWRTFYAERDYDRMAYLDGEAMADYAAAFFEAVGVPDSVASVGCGPAVTLFDLAGRYPGTDFVGYDVAEAVVRDNRERAAAEGRDNLAFEVGALPDLDAGRTFDVVYCVATLYFVADAERALRRLHAHVAPGGHLVVDYPTADLQAWVRDQDEETRAFFELVEAGENVLTRADVEAALDAPVRDYWEIVEGAVERSEEQSLPDAKTDVVVAGR